MSGFGSVKVQESDGGAPAPKVNDAVPSVHAAERRVLTFDNARLSEVAAANGFAVACLG
mgnify:CR=1 FL=1